MAERKYPVRMCVACRTGRQKRELVRVVRSPSGGISLDFRGKAPGRGAYICPSADCLKKSRKSRAIERALGCDIPPEVYLMLEEQLAGGPDGSPDGG